MKKIINVLYIIVFFGVLLIPLIFFDKSNEVSEAEKRNLNTFPNNTNFEEVNSGIYFQKLENWFSDHIGFREKIISSKAVVDYNFFDKINTQDMYVSSAGDLVYATKEIIESYQRKKLLTEEELKKISDSYYILQEYLNSLGIQFYYVPCYDKQSIYLESFLNGVNQYFSISERDQIINKLLSDGKVNVIDFKNELISAKKEYQVYGEWSDPTHWTQRGAFIGYTKIMDTITKNNTEYIKVLTEKDYKIENIKKGYNLNNNNYNYDDYEYFYIKKPNASSVPKSVLGKYSTRKEHFAYENLSSNNELDLLVIGDSYIYSYILDDLAESFSNSYMIHIQFLNYDGLNYMIEKFQPDIIILEDAERGARVKEVVNTAKGIMSKKK